MRAVPRIGRAAQPGFAPGAPQALAALFVAAALAPASCPAQQVYRFVGPDGRVTFTDQPPADAPAAPRAAAAPAQAAPATAGPDARTMTGWPAALRSAATRFPVTLYAAEACAPCDEARRLLQRRGVPYEERRVHSDDDVRRLEQLTGARLVPAATIGRQVLSGFQEQDWQGWLDTAGYPRTASLPRGWQAGPALPLVAPTAAAAASVPAAAASTPPRRLPTPPAPEPAAARGSVRF